jgi:hypothetical protein
MRLSFFGDRRSLRMFRAGCDLSNTVNFAVRARQKLLARVGRICRSAPGVQSI